MGFKAAQQRIERRAGDTWGLHFVLTSEGFDFTPFASSDLTVYSCDGVALLTGSGVSVTALGSLDVTVSFANVQTANVPKGRHSYALRISDGTNRFTVCVGDFVVLRECD